MVKIYLIAHGDKVYDACTDEEKANTSLKYVTHKGYRAEIVEVEVNQYADKSTADALLGEHEIDPEEGFIPAPPVKGYMEDKDLWTVVHSTLKNILVNSGASFYNLSMEGHSYDSGSSSNWRKNNTVKFSVEYRGKGYIHYVAQLSITELEEGNTRLERITVEVLN